MILKLKKKLELKWLSGSIIELGRAMNINFDINNEIVHGIKLK